jgi:hypothetical protein
MFYFERRAKIPQVKIEKEQETRDLRWFRKWQFNLLHTWSFMNYTTTTALLGN